MANRDNGKESSGTGRHLFCFLMAYLHLVTSEPSDEAKMDAPPSPPSSPRPDPESLTLPYSFPDNLLVLPAVPPQNDLHPVIGIMRDQELGKATLALAIPIAMAILTSGQNKLAQTEMSLILITLSVGCSSILNGILLRDTFPKPAQVLEPLGIALVFISFNGVVAFLLPLHFIWVPALCIGLSLLPFIIAASTNLTVSCGINPTN